MRPREDVHPAFQLPTRPMELEPVRRVDGRSVAEGKVETLSDYVELGRTSRVYVRQLDCLEP